MSTIVSKNVQIGADGTASNNFTAYQPATPDGTLRIGNGNSGSVTDAITLTSAGNLGLGVTPSAWDTFNASFQIAGASLSGLGANNTALGSNAYYQSAWKYYGTASASLYQQNAGQHTWSVAPSGTAGNAISFTQAMTLDASGNLNIGNTGINSNFRLNLKSPSGNGGVVFVPATDGAAVPVLRMLNAAISTNVAEIGTASGTALYFSTGGTERARIDSSGNVGIGTATPRAVTNYSILGINGTTGSAIDFELGEALKTTMTQTASQFEINVVPALPMVFKTANTERMRIDSAGNVGIGTSSPNFGLSFGTSIGKTIALFENAGGSVYGIGMGGAGSAGDPYRTKIFSNGSERMAFTDAGDVLVGTTTRSNNEKVTIYQSANAVGISVRSNGGPALGNYESSDNGHAAYWTFGRDNATTGNFVFASNGSQKVAIDTSGNLNIGDSGNFGGRVSLAFNPATQHGIILAVSSGTFTNNYIAFQNSGGSKIGSISSNNSTVAYNTSSDYRLKEDWVAVADASTRVNALKPINFAWKATGERVDGFLAHELAEVVPEAVSGAKDAMRDVEYEVTPAVLNDEGAVVTPAVMGTRSVPEYQGIDQSKLVPLLTAALQEALAKIDDLTARVSALETA